MHEAGAVIAGGHTIIDDEVKYGLAVTGRVDPRRMLTNAGARAGDRLLLTKPLGTGVLATLAKRGELSDAHEQALLRSMRTLNADASRAAVAVGARCATDVTGFGLLGHCSHIARASGVTLVIRTGDVPRLPGADEAVRGGVRTGGAERNAAYLDPMVDWGAADEHTRAVLVDPQTSGGLLVALPPAAAREYLSRVDGAVEVGEVIPAADVGLVLA